MAGLLNLINEWRIRAVVLLSFAAHVFLVLFAPIRRRKAVSWRRLFLWMAYQVADWAAKYALSNLSLGSTSREQQLVAFWVPFLLLHLGGPDNISAYSLEDNKLSWRQLLNALFQVVVAFFVLYKHVFIGGSGTLRWATGIMFIAGVAKYLERSWALWKGDLGHIQSSGKTHKKKNLRTDQEALLVAHSLFYISKGAFADYSDDKEDPLKRERETRRELPPLEWKHMRKVVEMELSLMYDILYTKAAVIHTWPGYIIRVLSPPFAAAASLLFFFYSKDGQRRVDVVITYILLAATFLLDMRWLLRALGSTWTYAYLDARPRCWLHHPFLCTGIWHWLRRVVVSLDPGRLLSRAPSSYRMWSGTIGQYNLLHECTRDTPSLCSKLGKLAKCVGLEDGWNEYQYHYLRGLDISAEKVRKLLFETIRNLLKKPRFPVEYPMEKEACSVEEEEACSVDMVAAVDPGDRDLDEALNFGPESQEVILIWHIATDVFLWFIHQNAASSRYVKAIKVLSDYMVFLVIVRPDMLPGLKLKRMHRATRKTLDEIWRKKGSSSSSRISPGSRTRQKELASILRKMEDRIDRNMEDKSVLYKKSIILSDGTKCAEALLARLRNEYWEYWGEHPDDISKKRLEELIPALMYDPVSVWDMETLLEHILKAWARLLIYVSIRCSRDSHAKQLSRGGELTTIVWILAEHAKIFGIDK